MRKPLLFVCLLMCTAASAQWSSVAGGVFSGQPYQLYFDTLEQRLYAVGNMHYMDVDLLEVNGTTYYENGVWHPMRSGVTVNQPGPGLVDEVKAIVRYDSALVVAGSFYRMDSVFQTWQIAQWKDDEWRTMQLDSGTLDETSNIQRMTVLNDSLFVMGGMAWSIAGERVNGWAVWDGDQWARGDTTMAFFEGQVNQLLDFQGRRYAGGNFDASGYPHDLARWNGNAWETVGGGIQGDSWVNDMTVYDDKLYVCGEFNVNSGNPANALMAWDGTEWSNTFPQISFIAQCRNVLAANGKLWFCGPFQAQGLPGIYHFGVYDGQTLCVFGGNELEDAGRLCVAPDTVYAYVGGINVDVNLIGKWAINAPSDTCYTIVQGIEAAAASHAYDAFQLFPNPTNDVLSLRLPPEVQQQARTVRVVDMIGQDVSSIALATTGDLLIPLEGLATGTYSVLVLDPLGQTLFTDHFVRAP